MNQVGRMIVSVVFCRPLQDSDLFSIGLREGEDVDQFAILHLLQHAVAAHVNVIAGSDVGQIGTIGLGPALLMRLHGPSDDILLAGDLRLLLRHLAQFHKIVYQGMVSRDIEDLFIGRTDVVDPAVADMGRETAAFVEPNERQGGPHLLLVFCVPLIKDIICCTQRSTEIIFPKHAVLTGVPLYIPGHCVAHSLRGNFSGGMTAHPIA